MEVGGIIMINYSHCSVQFLLLFLCYSRYNAVEPLLQLTLALAFLRPLELILQKYLFLLN